MKKNNEMDIVFLLDRSGSMAGSEKDTIGGYNSYLDSQRKNNVLVTTVLFDGEYEVLHDRKKISEVKNLTNKEYFARGCTALLDAIGRTITEMDNKKAKKVIFVITTDGEENSSRMYTKKQISEMIKGHKNWEFMFIGADIDSFNEASSLGIKKENVCNYKKDEKGIKKMFGAISLASDMMYKESRIATTWKDELENYIEENKNA